MNVEEIIASKPDILIFFGGYGCVQPTPVILDSRYPEARRGKSKRRTRRSETTDQQEIRLTTERIQRHRETTRYAVINAPNRRRLTQLAIAVNLPRDEWRISDRRLKVFSPYSKVDWRENLRTQIYSRKQTMLERAQAAGKKTYKQVTAELGELMVELTKLLYLDAEALDDRRFAK